MTEKIDAFAHILPEKFFEEMNRIYPTEELRIYTDMKYLWDTDLPTRISDMDDFGIDRQVLTLANPAVWRGMEREQAINLTRLANDEMATIGEEHPDRFIPVGTLPLLDGEFLDELERCIDELGLAGVQIFTNIDGEPLDRERFHPFFEYVERKEIPIWLHPQLHEWYPWSDEYMHNKTFGWPFDTSLALARLVHSGIMERHPDLALITHHMGGMIPHFDKRIEAVDAIMDSYPYDTSEFRTNSIEYFRQFYGDTVLNGSIASLDCGLDFFGVDHLVFATDYPFGPNQGRAFLKDTIHSIEELQISDSGRRKVYSSNLKRLLGL